ncbi:hypothetical protein BC830DRAFT_657474 [Chytriomyces sp. MP71]|nr:hypothetical protein BC830DRAFT_657474 [Chytriomyces sp. MP71]
MSHSKVRMRLGSSCYQLQQTPPGNTRLFSNSKYTASPSTFSPDANADTIIPITASAAATELADTPPAIASSSASNNPSKDIELEIVVLGGPSTEDVNTKSASDPRGALAKPAFGSRLRLDNLVAVVSKRSSSPSGSSIGQPKNKGIIPAPDISSPSDPRLSLDSPTPISPVSTAKRSRSVDQPTDRVEPLAVTLAPFRIRSGTTGGAKFTPFDSSSPPSRRLSPWRLFDNASDPHSASSSPIRYDGAGAFLVSKSLVAYEGRKSLTGRGGRVVEVLKLHDGLLFFVKYIVGPLTLQCRRKHTLQKKERVPQ